jgi:DNA-binding response OmpR family regulator
MSSQQGNQAIRGPRFTPAPSSLRRPALKVLFIDADPARSQELQAGLPPGCIVAIVSSIQEALGIIAQQAPDLIVTELALPDGSGLQLLARVHQNPVTRHALLMVVTARATLRDKIAALEAGADDFLVRPIDPDRFGLHVQLISRFRRTLQR